MLKGLSFLAASELGTVISRNIKALVFYTGAVIAGIMSLTFALLAAYSWLIIYMSAIMANLVIAAGLLMLAGALVLTGVYIKHRARPPTAVASAALIALPLAAGVLARKPALSTFLLAGVVALGAIAGRYAGRN